MTGNGEDTLVVRFRNRRLRTALVGYLFAAPAILGLVLWVIGPMIASLVLSFTDWNVFTTPRWIGLTNYVRLFTTDPFFRKSLIATGYFAVANIALTILYAFLLALLLNQDIKGKAAFRSIYYLPTIVPVVASSLLWLWLYNPDFGLFNTILRELHLPRSLWLMDEKLVIPSIVLMSVWGGSGNTIVIFLAGLQGVPRQLLEAVEIDGGNWWHKLRSVTLPMMSPVIFFNLVIGLIFSFQIFTQAYIMTNGGPNNASLFYVFLLYREGFLRNNLGGAAALAWILFLIVSALTVLIFRSARQWVYYEAEMK